MTVSLGFALFPNTEYFCIVKPPLKPRWIEVVEASGARKALRELAVRDRREAACTWPVRQHERPIRRRDRIPR